jgi:hypothetical protein
LGIEGDTFYTWVTPRYADARGFRYDSYDYFSNTFQNEWNVLYGCKNNYFIPTVSTGWDSCPRNLEQGSCSFYTDSTPEKYKAMLQKAKSFVDQKNSQPKIIINEAWDEWGEGAVLAPTKKWGFAYLDAVKAVFGTCQNQCVGGTKQCSGNGYQVCALSGECFKWGEVTTCAGGQTCSNGNCISTCVPKSCTSLGDYQCGSWSDGCGSMLNCGTCVSGKTCNNGQCVISGDSGGGGTIIEQKNNQINPITKLTRAEILQKIAQIKQLLIQLIAQLIIELQKQLATMPKNG